MVYVTAIRFSILEYYDPDILHLKFKRESRVAKNVQGI